MISLFFTSSADGVNGLLSSLPAFSLLNCFALTGGDGCCGGFEETGRTGTTGIMGLEVGDDTSTTDLVLLSTEVTVFEGEGGGCVDGDGDA